MKKILLILFAVLVVLASGFFVFVSNSLMVRHCTCHRGADMARIQTYGGIGLSIQAIQNIGGPFVVTSVMPGEPADTAGLKANDYIVAINNIRFSATSTVTDASTLLRGAPGTSVSVTVIRLDKKNVPSEITVSMTRTLITVPLIASWPGSAPEPNSQYLQF